MARPPGPPSIEPKERYVSEPSGARGSDVVHPHEAKQELAPEPVPAENIPAEDEPHHEDFFQQGEEGSYEGGPADIAARHAAVASLHPTEDPEQVAVSMRPTNARTRKFHRAVLGVVGICAVIVVLAAVLRGRRSSRLDQEFTSPSLRTQNSEQLGAESGQGAPPDEQVPAPEPDAEEDSMETTEELSSSSPVRSSTTDMVSEQSAEPASPPVRVRSRSVGAPGSRAIERAKTTRRPSENPPSAGFPEPNVE
jgi:hypothetical protein